MTDATTELAGGSEAEQRSAAELLLAVFRAAEAKDVDGVLALLADDAVFIDPHYPRVENRGKAQIRESLQWGIGSLEQMRFHDGRVFTAPDGSAVIEVDTHHTIKGKNEVRFPQLFAVEARDGLLTSVRAFEPYGPHGILKVILRVTRLKKRLTGSF